MPTEAFVQDPNHAIASFMYFRLYIAVQWLGWSRDWSPPAEHAHDWLSEALSLAEELEL